MFLKRLELSGFKSFATRTALDFGYDEKSGKNIGITAIVGPNGSGKSNIADAVRWVIGEQSMKNLRGKKAEDIIFAGSGKKARLGSAGVTLILDNSDKKIPLDFNEVVITRKVYRSGDPDFFINGSRVRLQDIVDILAGAGVGKESYAIVNQGMADSVLSATPVQRRMLIEDAAGVKTYQIKKERSIRKLDSTRQNLERVSGLMEEIKPHLRLLKRQADRASQSESVGRELKEKQTNLFSKLWHDFRGEKNKLNEKKEEIGREMMNVQREVDKLSDAITAQSKDAKEGENQNRLEEKERKIRENLNRFERDLIVAEGRIEIEKEKQKNVKMFEAIKTKSISIDLPYVKLGLDEIRADQEKLIARIDKAEKIEELQDIKEFARVIQQKLYDLKLDIEKGKKEKKIMEKEFEENIKPGIDSKIILEFEKKISFAREEIKKNERELDKIQKELREEIEKNRERRKNFFEIERSLRAKQDILGKIKDRFNESKIELAKIEVREDDLKDQVKRELKKNIEELFAPKEKLSFDLEKLQSEIFKLKGKMEQIGGIDPAVIDEFNDTNKRFEFLASESDDLEKATTSLREVIKEMEQKIEEKFNSTYKEINKEFSKYFKVIFGGGQAQLTKKKEEKRKKKEDMEEFADERDEDIEEENKEEEEREQIGIDISACPPGKKIANLNMLSGGERSLTSLALLFAIISHNPPPFAILDEVEAALDEANSRRFGKILLELSQDTQFVIITHNRETMRQASLLYGVTMSEDGISKLLSVRIDQIGAGGKIRG